MKHCKLIWENLKSIDLKTKIWAQISFSINLKLRERENGKRKYSKIIERLEIRLSQKGWLIRKKKLRLGNR